MWRNLIFIVLWVIPQAACGLDKESGKGPNAALENPGSTASFGGAGTPSRLARMAVQGGPNPSPWTVVLKNEGDCNLSYAVSTATVDGAGWFSVSPTSGALASLSSTPLSVPIDVIQTALAPGTYTGTIIIAGTCGATGEPAVGSPLAISVNLTVTEVEVVDTAPPANTTGANFINHGAPSTTSTSVTLDLSATDETGVVGYYASENATPPFASASGWTAVAPALSYSASVPFTLSPAAGAKTVYVWFKDAAGNVSTSASDSIDLIAPPPQVHISYYDSTNGDLKYATNASGGWVAATVDSAGDVGRDTSLAVDSSGKVHISYFDFTNGALKYATNASGGWVTATVDGATGYATGAASSLAIDSSGKVHISYLGGANFVFNLRYATNASGAWVTTTVDNSSGLVGFYSSLALDSAGKAHISYIDSANFKLKYATNASGAWASAIVDNSAFIGGGATSLALDTSDKAHISYFDPTNTVLKYATNASGAWVAATVDSAGMVGLNSSLALDASGKAHISYHDNTHADLKYATNASGTWVTATLDSANNMGQDTSLGVDSSGKIHISYLDVTNADLKYATNASGTWVTSTVDSAGSVGFYSSLKVK